MEIDPQNARALVMLSDIELSSPQPNFDRSLQLCHHAFEIEPQQPAVASRLGNIHGMLGNFALARQWFEKAVALGTSSAEDAYNLGVICFKHFQDGPSALAAFREAVLIQHTHVDAHRAMGMVLSDLGDHVAAAASYRAALNLLGNGQHLWLQQALANELCVTGQFSESLQIYDRLLSEFQAGGEPGEVAEVMHNRAVCQQRSGHAVEAVQGFAKAYQVR